MTLRSFRTIPRIDYHGQVVRHECSGAHAEVTLVACLAHGTQLAILLDVSSRSLICSAMLTARGRRGPSSGLMAPRVKVFALLAGLFMMLTFLGSLHSPARFPSMENPVAVSASAGMLTSFGQADQSGEHEPPSASFDKLGADRIQVADVAAAMGGADVAGNGSSESTALHPVSGKPVRGEIITCPACRLNGLPQVKKFVKGYAKYFEPALKVTFIFGEDPRLHLYESETEVENIDLSVRTEHATRAPSEKEDASELSLELTTDQLHMKLVWNPCFVLPCLTRGDLSTELRLARHYKKARSVRDPPHQCARRTPTSCGTNVRGRHRKVGAIRDLLQCIHFHKHAKLVGLGVTP